MPSVLPFKAVRPTRDKVHLVVTKPYYNYRSHILKARLEHNPYSFLHIIEPDDMEITRDMDREERFAKVRGEFDRFISEGIFQKDAQDSFYIYRQVTPERSFMGVIGAVSVEDYDNGLVKKHELTLEKRENLFTDYLDAVGFNAEPVLLSYQHRVPLEDQFGHVISQRPEYEFTTSDMVLHELWVVSDENDVAQMRSRFADTPALYIADGHHRSASSARLCHRRERNGVDVGAASHFLCYLLEEDELAILDYNRVVKDLGDLSHEDFLQKVREKFQVKDLTDDLHPVTKGTYQMYLHGHWYELSPTESRAEVGSHVEKLDAHLLNKEILEPMLGIGDLRNDNRVGFVDGSAGREGLAILVDQSVNGVGFLLCPVDFEELKAVADENGIMPPKSTWIEPKLRSGLTIYELRDDS